MSSIKHDGCSMNTVSWKSPFKKALLKCSCLSDQLFAREIDSSTHMVIDLTIRLSVSLKSKPST